MTDSKQTPLSLERFAQLLDSYGADPARWPDDLRSSARSLLDTDAEARALHEGALQLDQLLNSAPAPEAPANLRARVLEIPIRHERKTASRFFGLRWAAFALVPCMIGFLSGTLLPDAASDYDDDDVWNELASVALPNDVFDEDLP